MELALLVLIVFVISGASDISSSHRFSFDDSHLRSAYENFDCVSVFCDGVACDCNFNVQFSYC